MHLPQILSRRFSVCDCCWKTKICILRRLYDVDTDKVSEKRIKKERLMTISVSFPIALIKGTDVLNPINPYRFCTKQGQGSTRAYFESINQRLKLVNSSSWVKLASHAFIGRTNKRPNSPNNRTFSLLRGAFRILLTY